MQVKPFKLERYYTNYEFTAKYSLCNSDCESMAIKDLLAFDVDAKEKFNNLWLGYTETKGDPLLRKQVAATYTTIKSEDMLICSGAQEPIYLFSMANLAPEDEVIVQTPCYQSLQSIPESIGCKVKNWTVEYQHNHPTFDLGALKSMITNKTRVIYLNSPHNPTGFHFTKTQQDAIIEMARAHNIIILCDEVYRAIEHSPEYAIPAFADAYENGVSIGVMSKSYGLPGLRIGWIASQQQQILENIAILKEYTTICNAGPSEFLASLALKHQTKILDRNLSIINDNLTLFDAFFERQADLFSWYRPNAGPIAFVKMNFSNDDMAFAARVLKEQSILLLPGGIYDFPGYFRIGFGRTMIPESLHQFELFVQQNLR